MYSMCYQTEKDYINKYKIGEAHIEKDLLKYGCCPLHTGMRSRENIVRNGFLKRAMSENMNKETMKWKVCAEIQNSFGSRLYQPDPENSGNSNTGENLRRLTSPENTAKTAEILDCKKEFLDNLNTVLNILESCEMQNISKTEALCRTTFEMYKENFPGLPMSPSLHRALQHTPIYMQYFQTRGVTIGDMSEQGQEASNYDVKQNRKHHSDQSSHEKSNLQCFERSWWSSDFLVLMFL